MLVGPTAIVLGLVACALAFWTIGWLLTRPITLAEATEALYLHESFRFSRDSQAELPARGLTRPDLEIARRWSAELARIRAMRVVALSQRPTILWPLTRRTRCVTRMEIEEPSASGPPLRVVRYYRVDCGWLAWPRITRVRPEPGTTTCRSDRLRTRRPRVKMRAKRAITRSEEETTMATLRSIDAHTHVRPRYANAEVDA